MECSRRPLAIVCGLLFKLKMILEEITLEHQLTDQEPARGEGDSMAEIFPRLLHACGV